jgi:hypothetical protein
MTGPVEERERTHSVEKLGRAPSPYASSSDNSVPQNEVTVSVKEESSSIVLS